jgi:hypothetical protein
MKKTIKLTRPLIMNMIEESVRRVLKEENEINSEIQPSANQEVQQPQLSKALLKIKAKVEEIAQMVNGNKCIPVDSTWQLPYTPNYTVQVYRGNSLKVVRTEQSDTYYNNGGQKIESKPEKDIWIITDKNYKTKWNGDEWGYGGLKYVLSDDRKGYRAYNS